MDTIWRFLAESGPETIVLVVVACLVLMAQAGILLVGLLLGPGRGSGAAFRWAAALTAAGPVAVGVLMVLAAVAGHDRVFDAVTSADPAAKAMFLARGLAHAMNAWLAGGCALIGLALFGSAAVLVTGRRVEPGAQPVGVAVPAVLGLAAAAGLVGAGLILRASDSITGFSALSSADPESKGALLARLIQELPSLLPWTLVGLACLAGGALAAGLALARKPGLRVPGAAMASVLAVLGLGTIAFFSTLGRAADHDRNLQAALELLGDADAGVLPERGLRLPELSNTAEFAWAPVLTAGDGRLSLDGQVLDRLPPPGEDDRPEPLDLHALDDLVRRMRSLHPQEPDAARTITLQADVSLGAPVLEAILRGCLDRGFDRVQLAVPVRRQMSSAVLGPLTSTRYRALVLELTPAAGAHALPTEGTLGDMSAKLDAWATGGRVRVRLGTDRGL